jgi:hypothetical protein
VIIIVEVLTSTFAYLKANPRVSPSAHLWHATANAIPKHVDGFYSIPIAKPSNTA